MSKETENEPKGREVSKGFRCLACDTPFMGTMIVDVEITIAMESMLANRCPKCGSAEMSLGLNLTLSEDRERRTKNMADKYKDWLENGEVGISSQALAAFMLKGEEPHSYPHDYDDLRRVILLLDRFPEWKRRMHRMAQFEGWHEIATRWKEIETAVLAADPEARRPTGAKDILETVFKR